MTIHFQHLHITPKTVRILGMILIMFLFSSLTVRQAQAAPLRQTGCTLPATVTTTNELSDCITEANANGAGLDTITLGADITLTSALPQIITRITVEGAGYFIDGGNSVRIFYVAPSGDFTVNRTTLKNGNTTGQGGGIFNDGGRLMVSNSTFSGNSATSGGGIYNNASSLTVSNSTFSGNRATNGGGIYNGAVLTVSNSTFSGNSATGNGGGIFNAGYLEMSNSTISGNSATGNGGGIFINNAGLGLTNSTISGNSATSGGGIYANQGTLTVRNSTFSGNSATGNGGGISSNNTLLKMTSTTISGNRATSGGGMYYGGGEVYLAGVILASGSGGDNCATNDGTNFGNNFNLFDNHYNLADDASCGFWRNSSINNATLNLGNLADNGGPTQTHLPAPDSDAIGVIPSGGIINNNGTSWTCNQSATDQRGELRPINSGDACSAGAVEEVIPICPSWTATSTAELFACITLANTNESPSPTADTITLGADITLSTALPQITSEITLVGANHVIDGGNSVRHFDVNSGGELTLNQVTLQNGFTTDGGGGIFNKGTLTVTDSIISVNTASYGGGVYNRGTLMVSNSTFSGNSAPNGGGIFNSSISAGPVTVSNSTFSGNMATAGDGGGIVNNLGTNHTNIVTVSNSTFSGNTATGDGGGIFNYDALTVTNSTFSGNTASGGGGFYSWQGTVRLAGTIFAAGLNGGNCFRSGGTFTDNGYNLSDDASCAFSGTGSADNAILKLGTLADNGGPTQTHLPALGSDAIGAIPNGTMISNNGTSWTCDQSSTDQRGELRPINSSDGCAAGAVEVVPVCPFWTATTASELADCITLANANESPSPTVDTITLGADITLTGPLPFISSPITLAGAGYALDGADTYRIFYNISTFTINQATLRNGRASGDFGGGIFNDGGTLTVTNSTLSGSSADFGGGIFNFEGFVTVRNSTLSGNSATTSGGGIYNAGGSTLTITNSTISGNSATTGGGLLNAGALTVTSSTFYGNSGGSFSSGGTTAYLAGNVFAVGGGGPNCSIAGTVVDNGYNLSDDATCGFGGAGSANNATLNLGPLANNGGPTRTHLPGPVSDATGAIPNGTIINNNGTSWTCNDADTFTDQRGQSRPINSGEGCTPGAVEVAPVCTSWTVTTDAELADCINLANANESPSPTADTILLGADITLSSALPQITSEITVEGAGYFIDGGNSVRIFNVGTTGRLSVNQAVLQNGFSTGNGGGINNRGTLTVTNSTVSGNTASASDGGGIYNFGGTVTVLNSTFSGNRTIGTSRRGGGIYTVSGMVRVTNSTFSGNSAAGSLGRGGAIYSSNSPVIATNSTFSGNSATGSGGGIYYSGALRLAGTLFARGANGNNCVNSGGTLFDNGYNLSDDASCGFSGTSADNATLNLGALADNGGATWTHALLPGSDAFDAIPYGTIISNNGTIWTCNNADPFTDQRGVARPQGLGCDSGAYEVEASQTGPNLIVNTDADTNDGFCDLPGQGLGNQDCTLREAINAANTAPDASEITFAGDYTITLTAMLPFIDTEIIINGVGRSVTVDGNNTYTVFSVRTASALTLDSLTLAHGHDTIINGEALTVRNSTFRDGVGEVGGIYSGGSQLIIVNSTFYNNQGVNTGAIQADSGTAVINNVTLSGNSGGLAGGVYSYDRPVTITNSIITNSTGGDCATDFGSFSGSNNLIDDHASGACAGISSAAVTHLDTSPANHGGDTHTIALLAGSNAINAGNNATCEGTDQRGVTRPINGSCDSGAYEGGTLVCSVSADNTYTFPQQSGVAIHVVSTTDLGCLYVEEVPMSHPNATGAGEGQALRTGKYWRIRALQDASGTTANSYVANLTLPHDNLNNPKACKYTGGAGYGWECAADASTSSTVTRNGLTSFSDWAVGGDVGPTAVSLQSIAVTSNRQAGVWLAVLVMGLITAAGLWRRRTGQSS